MSFLFKFSNFMVFHLKQTRAKQTLIRMRHNRFFQITSFS